MASWSESGKSGKHLIHITHFFDPNHFWFKFTDPIQSNEAALSKLDAKIHEHAAKQRHEKSKSWRIGDIIAAYNITWNKWVRGKVENVIEMENGTPRYFLWALDYGTPLNVIGNYTRDLPQKLAQHRIFAVNEGCIYRMAPAEQTFDVTTLETRMAPTNEWSKKAIKTCKEIFAASAFVVFEITDDYIDAQYALGTLRVQLYNGDIKDVSESLKELHYVMEIDNFDSVFDEIKSKNKLHRMQCSRGDFIDEDIEESDQDSDTSTDSGSECARATLSWINGNNVVAINGESADTRTEVRLLSTDIQHKSRLEKLRAQTPRFPRPLQPQSISGSSQGLSDADNQQFKQHVSIPTGRRRLLLNNVPMPSGHERETDGFLKCNPKDLY